MNCEHKFECGCGKTLCEECEEYLIENDDDHFGLDCLDEDCPEYYRHRNDNCGCHGFDCGYCNGEAEKELCRDSDEETDEDDEDEDEDCDCHAEDCGICKKTNTEYHLYQMAERVTAKMTAEDKKIYMDKIPQILLELKELEKKLKNN